MTVGGWSRILVYLRYAVRTPLSCTDFKSPCNEMKSMIETTMEDKIKPKGVNEDKCRNNNKGESRYEYKDEPK